MESETISVETSLSTDVLFLQKIVERANENSKPRDMTANAEGGGGGGG